MNLNSFNIYDASAGSGKTFTLVKEYLKILFKSSNRDAYRYILAITFTNKAVGEMKQRIIKTLKTFAGERVLESENDMLKTISIELDMEPLVLHEKSKEILSRIVHNYAAFDISTIDKFTQKLIRAFAYDLGLPINFEVSLDTDALLNQAVDRLISKAGIDNELTKVLIAFAFEKADEDKSWDVALDFYKIAKLLTNENDAPAVETLKKKTLEDFKPLKSGIKQKIKASEELIIEIADNVITLITECGLEDNDFANGYLPKHFKNLANKKFNINFDAKWQEDIESRTLYPKRVTHEIASVIEDIQQKLVTAFNDSKQEVFNLKFLTNFYKNITPLSVLNLISNELTLLKEEQNVLLISEFNTIISNEIKNQPSPFIYERIGEKFRHYFIDEFQDTSVMQWENLIPLFKNALSSENGNAMLVGDAKQAIYRWRGGKAEQFIGLCNDENPFFIEKSKHQLPTNYRSFKEIIGFNNRFFSHLSTFALNDVEYKSLYENSTQNTSLSDNGYVSLTFLDIDPDNNIDEVYPKKVLEIIENCLKNGFQQKDICVLVRKKKEGVAIAEFISNSDYNYDIISSETLLLDQSPEVRFIDSVLQFILEPKDKESKIEVLHYLATYKFDILDKHAFFNEFINLEIQQFFQVLKKHDVSFRYEDVLQLPLYESVEAIIYGFNLAETSNAYIQFYLDFVLEYSRKNNSSLSQFIDYYNSKKETLSIVSPEGKNAIQIMTIHKSKGLEFPVVIFPYADLDLYRELNPREWFPVDPENYYGFSQALLNYNKDFQNYGELGEHIFAKHQAELELDNINLLYVALTRAIEQLHIISTKQLDRNGNENLKNYSGMFINFLKHIELWDVNKSFYEFGKSAKTSQKKQSIINAVEQDTFITNPKAIHNINIITNSGFLWDTTQQEAIEKGNLVHDIMAHIKTTVDVDITLNNFLTKGIINKEQEKELKKIVLQIISNSLLRSYFNTEDTVYTEKDIVTKHGTILRPDRLNISGKNEVTILDYKTGLINKKHGQQLETYSDALREMGFSIDKKILIYINDSLEIKEV